MRTFNFKVPAHPFENPNTAPDLAAMAEDAARELGVIQQNEALNRFVRFLVSSDMENDFLTGHFRVVVDVPEMFDFCDESQRQIILLALHKLRTQRPGWDYAISEIEQKMGGQLDFPAEEPEIDWQMLTLEAFPQDMSDEAHFLIWREGMDFPSKCQVGVARSMLTKWPDENKGYFWVRSWRRPTPAP